MSHGKIVCRICGELIAQCRCIECGNHIEYQVCSKCSKYGTGKSTPQEYDAREETGGRYDKPTQKSAKPEVSGIPSNLKGRFTLHNILCIEANIMDCEEADRIEKLIKDWLVGVIEECLTENDSDTHIIAKDLLERIGI